MALQEIGLILAPNPYYQKGKKLYFSVILKCMFPLIRT